MNHRLHANAAVGVDGIKIEHSYYCLRDADVAHAIEALSFTANLARQKTAHLEPALKQARRCYDHIAGALGVAICDSVILRGRIIAGSDGFAISATGYEWLARLDLSPPSTIRRALKRNSVNRGLILTRVISSREYGKTLTTS